MQHHNLSQGHPELQVQWPKHSWNKNTCECSCHNASAQCGKQKLVAWRGITQLQYVQPAAEA